MTPLISEESYYLIQKAKSLHLRTLIGRRSNRHRTTESGNGTIVFSSMTFSEVDRGDSIALHLQVAAEIRRAIADGEASQGERLPPAVDLAAVLGVNKNTVIRALHILRDEGVLDFTRGRGIRVVGTPARSAIMNKVNELVTLAREQGYRKDELASMIVSVYQQGLS